MLGLKNYLILNKEQYMSKISETELFLLNVYKGILLNNPLPDIETDKVINYEFDLKNFEILKEKYNISKIAGKGSDFERSIRILKHFSPKLRHDSYYGNHIKQNSVDILEYSYKTENGINC